MPRITRHNTPHGPRYFLDSRSLENGDVVEVWSPGAAEACHRGRFFWTGDANDEPFVWNAQFGCRVRPDSDFRRYVADRVEYIQPPMAPEPKDHERRAPSRVRPADLPCVAAVGAEGLSVIP